MLFLLLKVVEVVILLLLLFLWLQCLSLPPILSVSVSLLQPNQLNQLAAHLERVVMFCPAFIACSHMLVNRESARSNEY